MSAQRELAELLHNTDNRAGAWQFEAQNWIRDHGPAIAELIEAASLAPEYRFSDKKYRISGIELRFGSISEAHAFIRRRIASAAAKLTEPKA